MSTVPSSPTPDPTSDLNPDQARSLFVGLGQVDRLLLEIDRLTRDIGSPFTAKSPDLSADDAALLQTFVARTRAALMDALDTLGIARPAPDGSARWSIQTTLTFADVALGDLTPSVLRGYGTISDPAAETVATVVRRLHQLLREGIALLHEQDPGGLADRIARLPGAPGEILRTLDRLTRTDALDALRPLIAAVAERAEDMLLTVGVFGRVSVGKSSLINALIGAEVLPVGVAPVTAVPIRVEHGAPGVVVDYLSGERTTGSLDTLGIYVTEQENPKNRRGIRAVTVTVPEILEGIRILDTPGVGSLSTTGPAQSFAWLPRCDLGLVLIAPGTPVGRDEVALLSGLVNAGIPCRVILSKADTVSADDMATTMRYVETELHQVLGTTASIPLTAVSVHPDHATGLETIRRDVVEPLAADHLRHTRMALAQRLRTLIETTRHQLAQGDASRRAPPTAAASPADPLRVKAVQIITHELRDATSTILTQAARHVADAWARGEEGRQAARTVIVSAACAALARVREATETPAHMEDHRRLPPLFDPEWLDTLPRLTPPTFARGPFRYPMATRRLAVLRPVLETALTRYAARLAAWGDARIEQNAAVPADDPQTTRFVQTAERTAHPAPDTTAQLFEHLLGLVDQLTAGPFIA